MSAHDGGIYNMTQKHLIALAAALRSTRPTRSDGAEPLHRQRLQLRFAQWEQDVVSIANACDESNPRFKRGVFYTACGIE